jgi:hypothetical protein
MTQHTTQPCPDAPSHPCAEKGLSTAHIRVFHGIATGLSRGHDPAIVQDLLAHDLVRAEAAGYVIPEAILGQLARWIEQTAAEINARVEADQT